jgi:predicted small metal-binding protein
MKTITCNQMGGTCDAKFTGNTPEEIVGQAMKHVEESHPEMAANIKKMSDEDSKKWMDNFVANTWAKTPDTSAPTAPIAA